MSSGGLVLITGGSGQVGSRIVRALGRHGWRRRCLIHRNPVDGVEETQRGDLTDVASLQVAVRGVAAIMHLGAVTHSRAGGVYQDVNARGTENLLQAAREAGVSRFVFISTRAISPDGGAYSQSKHRAEEAVRRSSLAWTIVRLPELYGAGGGEGIERIIALARNGDRIPLVGRGADVLCPVHVDDAVAACVRTLEVDDAVARTYTLAGPCLTTREFASVASLAFGHRPRLVSVPLPIVATIARVSRVLPIRIYPDQLARLRAPKPELSPAAGRDLSFRPRLLSDGLAELAASHT